MSEEKRARLLALGNRHTCHLGVCLLQRPFRCRPGSRKDTGGHHHHPRHRDLDPLELSGIEARQNLVADLAETGSFAAQGLGKRG